MLNRYYHSEDFLYDVLCRGKKIKNDEQECEINASYMAMCLLLPDKSFQNEIINMGGLEKVANNSNKVNILSNKFLVSKKLVLCKIKSLMVKYSSLNDHLINLDSKNYLFFNTGEHIVSVPSDEKVLNDNYKLVRIDENNNYYVNLFPVIIDSIYYFESTNHFGELFVKLDENEVFYKTKEHKIQFDNIDDYLNDQNHMNYDLQLGNNIGSNTYLNNTPVVSLNNASGITLEENAKRKLLLHTVK